MNEANQVTLLERQRDDHKGQAKHLENAASRLKSQRTNIEHKKILFEGHYELGSREMSSQVKTAYKAFVDAWHQLGPGLIRAAELDLLARARVEREKMRAIEPIEPTQKCFPAMVTEMGYCREQWAWGDQ